MSKDTEHIREFVKRDPTTSWYKDTVVRLSLEVDKLEKKVHDYDKWLSGGVYFTADEYMAEVAREASLRGYRKTVNQLCDELDRLTKQNAALQAKYDALREAADELADAVYDAPDPKPREAWAKWTLMLEKVPAVRALTEECQEPCAEEETR